jgi:hypothetical protein
LLELQGVLEPLEVVGERPQTLLAVEQLLAVQGEVAWSAVAVEVPELLLVVALLLQQVMEGLEDTQVELAALLQEPL